MPFTPTHILATVPVHAVIKRLPFTALAIGSMVPDLVLFASWAPPYDLTHSWTGIVLADLPMGLVLFALFEFVLKEPLIELLPRPLQSRLEAVKTQRVDWSFKTWAWISLALMIGALTHSVWDAFTHANVWGTALFPVLQDPLFSVAGRDVKGYKALQYGSSLIGLPTLAVLAWLWLRAQPPRAVQRMLSTGLRFTLWGLIGIVTLSVILWIGLDPKLGLYQKLGRTVTTLGAVLMSMAVAWGVVFQLVVTRLRWISWFALVRRD